MTAYVDASVAVSLFIEDTHSTKAAAWMAHRPRAALSAWTPTEVTSAFSLALRIGRMLPDERERIERTFDAWLATVGVLLVVENEDFRDARELMRRHAALRAGDALHLAIAARHDMEMATFDERLASAARAEGLGIIDWG